MELNKMEIQSIQQPKVEFNHKEAKEYLSIITQRYENWVVTDESLSEAKKTLADLNKLKKNIDDFRKKTKKELETPIKQFETLCKDLISDVDGVYLPIKTQAEEFEVQRKEQKKKDIEAMIDEKLQIDIPDRYKNVEFMDHWLNKSTSNAQIEKEIEMQINEKKKEYEDHLAKVKAIDMLAESLSYGLDAPINPEKYYQLELIQAQERMNADAKYYREAQEARERKLKEQEAQKIIAEENTKEEIKPVQTQSKPAEQSEEKDFYHLSIVATKNEMNMIKEFMSANNIKYEID